MPFNWDLEVPYGYQNQRVTLRALYDKMSLTYNPEYVRRFIAWLHFKNGTVGAGGLSRTYQPDKPGFAATLEQSFHWSGHVYADGSTGACAVDTVAVDGPDQGDSHDPIAWSEVPLQGSRGAKVWGVHANVGVPGKGESWHLQPIEIDGHASWLKAGKPAPSVFYPIPRAHDPFPPPDPDHEPQPPTLETSDMLFIAKPTFPGSTDYDPWLVYYANPGNAPRAERATNAHVKAALILGVPVVDQDAKDQYDEACEKYLNPGVPDQDDEAREK